MKHVKLMPVSQDLTVMKVTGLEMQAFTCETQTGVDCVESFNFVSIEDVVLTVNK